MVTDTYDITEPVSFSEYGGDAIFDLKFLDDTTYLLGTKLGLLTVENNEVSHQ